MNSTISPSPAVLIVAPNGARRGKDDHPRLPLTIAETVAEAVLAHRAGAAILHAHVRDETGGHTLDSGLYTQLIHAMQQAAPEMLVQITTEAVGRYTPAEQAQCLFDVSPQMVSIALREMAPPEGLHYAKSVYAEAMRRGIHVQHILYSLEDFQRFTTLRHQGIVPKTNAALLFVLGKYDTNSPAQPDDLAPFLERKIEHGDDWTVCAFGPAENACIAAALGKGGNARIGFENNLALKSGLSAPNNAALVREAASAALAHGRRPATPDETRAILGLT